MTDPRLEIPASIGTDRWLKAYYGVRGAVSVLWVLAALTVGTVSPAVANVLVLIYPAWDALANVADARFNNGFRANPTQTLNAIVSGLTTVAVAVGLAVGMNAVLGVFGVWAAGSGLLQLATAVRRRRHVGGQWLLMVSGLQSAAAGVMFLRAAFADEVPGVADIAPYAAFGAFYFLLSAGWLLVSTARRRRSPAA